MQRAPERAKCISFEFVRYYLLLKDHSAGAGGHIRAQYDVTCVLSLERMSDAATLFSSDRRGDRHDSLDAKLRAAARRHPTTAGTSGAWKQADSGGAPILSQ